MQDISHFTFHLRLSIGDPQTGKRETRRPLLRPSTAVLGALFLGLPNCALALSLDSYGRQASERLDSRRFDLQLSTRGQASPHHSLQPRFRPAVWGWDGTANPCAARDAAFVVLPPACSWSIGAAALGCFHPAVRRRMRWDCWMGWSLAGAVVCPYAFMLLCSDAVSPFPGYFAVIRAVSIADLDARKSSSRLTRSSERQAVPPQAHSSSLVLV